MSLRAIARRTGASVTTVYRWIRRWQREGHVFTRARGCKPRTWNSHTPVIRATHDANARSEVSTCSHALNQPYRTDSNSYVLLKTQGKIDLTAATVPVTTLARHSSHSSGVMCRDTLHGNVWRCLDAPSSTHPLTPTPRALYSHLPGTSSELVAIRDRHRLSLAAFIDYLQLHESIHQPQAMTGYANKQCIGGKTI